ncbi:MAG: MoaD/ThiS family protein [Gammaproteobacteria bacterium]
MAHVVLTGNLRQFTGGQTEFDLPAVSVRKLFQALSERYPELAPHLEEGLAVAIDGEIFQDAWFEPIAPQAEVHLMPKIAGG